MRRGLMSYQLILLRVSVKCEFVKFIYLYSFFIAYEIKLHY